MLNMQLEHQGLPPATLSKQPTIILPASLGSSSAPSTKTSSSTVMISAVVGASAGLAMICASCSLWRRFQARRAALMTICDQKQVLQESLMQGSLVQATLVFTRPEVNTLPEFSEYPLAESAVTIAV